MAQLESELRFLKQMNIKPNYSALSREYGMDRHTIKKKMEGLDSPPRQKRPKPSSLDPLAEEIAQLGDEVDAKAQRNVPNGAQHEVVKRVRA